MSAFIRLAGGNSKHIAHHLAHHVASHPIVIYVWVPRSGTRPVVGKDG